MRWIAQNKMVLDSTNRVVAVADTVVLAEKIVQDHNFVLSIPPVEKIKKCQSE